jgi:hypothetical protein
MRKADNLPPSGAVVTESGSLNLPEPSVPHRPVMGLLYLLHNVKLRILTVKCDMLSHFNISVNFRLFYYLRP